MKSDEHLIELYNSGDIFAFDQLYERYKLSAYNFVLRLSGSKEEASDVYQSVWLKIVEKRDDFVIKIKKGDPPFVFKSYFFTMLRNSVYDNKSKSPAKYQVELDEASTHDGDMDSNSIETEIIAQANISTLLSAIDRLPAQQKETFLLIKECGLSLKDVAEVQRVSIETAKTRRRYAYDKLKPILEMMQ